MGDKQVMQLKASEYNYIYDDVMTVEKDCSSCSGCSGGCNSKQIRIALYSIDKAIFYAQNILQQILKKR